MAFHRSENLYRKENFQTIKEKAPKMEKKLCQLFINQVEDFLSNANFKYIV